MTEPAPTSSALPTAVRLRVVAIAADALGRLSADQVPAALRQVARFTPNRRARAGSAALASALETDPVFRQRVAARLREQAPDLAAGVEGGSAPPAADPVEVAAAAYLLRPDGWTDLVTSVAADLTAVDASGRVAELEAALERSQAAARTAKDDADKTTSRVRAELDRAQADLAEARRRTRDLEADLGRARAAAAASATRADQAAADATGATATAGAEARRLRARVVELEAALEASRRVGRDSRAHDDVRLRLLLDTVLGAAQGLRQELALPPVDAQGLPADRVAGAAGAGVAADPGVADVGPRALPADDPTVIDQLLTLPRVHVVVDGYNVTKSGYGNLALDQQRARLVGGLVALAARTRAEVTCVFDGASVGVPATSAPARGVRVLFSAEGQTADELIDQLVRAEPPGRPVVVVSSDAEVAGRATAVGARAVPSVGLLRRLDRA